MLKDDLGIILALLGKIAKYILKQIIMKCQKLSPLFAALTVGAKKRLILKM